MKIDIDEKDFLRYSMKIKFLLIDFIVRAADELTSDGFSNINFKIRTSDYYVIVYLLYSDDDPTILTWQVYLQEMINSLAQNLKIDFKNEGYDGVLIIIEHRNLWTSMRV